MSYIARRPWTCLAVGLDTKQYTLVRVPHQRQCFKAAGRWWVFFTRMEDTDPFNLDFTSSTDGKTWLASINLTTIPWVAAQYDVYWDGTYIHIAKNIQRDAVIAHDGLEYRRGTPNPDGTITWDAAWQTVIATGNFVGDISLVVDTGGHAWVGYSDADNTGEAAVVKNDNTDGTWSTATGFPTQLTSTGDQRHAIMCPLSGGAMYAVIYKYNAETNATGYVSSDGSNSFSSEGNVTDSNVEGTSGAAGVARIDVIGVSGAVHLVYQTTDHRIVYRTRGADGTLGDEAELAGSGYVNEDSSPRISYDSSGNLYVCWTGQEAIITYYCKHDGSWSTPAELFSEPRELSYEHLMPALEVESGNWSVVSLTRNYHIRHRVCDV